MIGQYGCNAGFQGKYQEAYWSFHRVTRTAQEPRASPHELSTYWNIRISVFQKSRTAAIFKYSDTGHYDAKSKKEQEQDRKANHLQKIQNATHFK